MQLIVKRFSPDAVLPALGSAGAAGLDLHAHLPERRLLRHGTWQRVPTGVGVVIPEGFEGQIRPRSGLSSRGIMVVLGTIDSDYRGELQVQLFNHGYEPFWIEPGARIAQLVISPVVRVRLVETSELPPTERGENGFGSTGVEPLR